MANGQWPRNYALKNAQLHQLSPSWSVNTASSSLAPAHNLSSRVFTPYCVLSERASERSIAPYLDVNLSNVASLIRCARRTSTVATPRSCSASVAITEALRGGASVGEAVVAFGLTVETRDRHYFEQHPDFQKGVMRALSQRRTAA